MKRILSVILCVMLLMTASVQGFAATVDIAASGDDYVYIDIYLYPDSESPVAGAQYKRGDVPTRPADPGRENMAFIDWYTSPAFTTRFDFSVPLYEDTAIYARFVPKDRVIGVNVFEAPDAPEPTFGYLLAKGDYAEYQGEPDVPDGMTFLGWYSDRELTQEFDFSQPVYDYVSLFPRIAADENIIYGELYLYADSEFPTAGFALEKGDLCPVPADPGREDEAFVGWYTDRALTEPMDFTKPMYSDFALFPKFEKIHHHDLVMVDIIRATDTCDGCKAHLECTTCGKWFEPIYTALVEIEDHDSLIIPARGPYLLGDVDGDGEVDVSDVTKLQRYLSEIKLSGGFCRGAADVDEDEEISAIDCAFIQRYNALIPTPCAIGEPVVPSIK